MYASINISSQSCCKKEMEKSCEDFWSAGGQMESCMIDDWLLGRTGLGKDRQERRILRRE